MDFIYYVIWHGHVVKGGVLNTKTNVNQHSYTNKFHSSQN